MGVLDDPAEYYGDHGPDWSLGDIAIVPAGVFWADHERPAQQHPQPAPSPNGTQSTVYSLWTPTHISARLPSPLIESWLTPAVIVADDCAMDKDFNARIRALTRQGIPTDEAVEQARGEPSLDPLIPVTPLLRYESLRTGNPEGVRSAQVTGYFPVLGKVGFVDEGYLDFSRMVPVSRQLFKGLVAAMSEPTRRLLRSKLAQYFGFRNLTSDSSIENALGRTITNISRIIDTKKKLVVRLELDDGEGELILYQEPKVSDAPLGHIRGRAQEQ